MNVELAAQLGDERLPPEVETALYRTVLGARLATAEVAAAARAAADPLSEREREVLRLLALGHTIRS